MEAVAKLITCDNHVSLGRSCPVLMEISNCRVQALMLADKVSFRNCLVVMRPATTSAELPSAYDIRNYLKNTFIQHLEQLRSDIKVSVLNSLVK